MKVATRKIFKFQSHLRHHQRRVEKLKVIYLWERTSSQSIFVPNFFKYFYFCLVFNLSGRKLDSDTDATGDEASVKVTMVVFYFICIFLIP